MFTGFCTLNPFHLAMVDQHKGLANALRNLKGIHGSGNKKKAPVKEKDVAPQVETPVKKESLVEAYAEDSAPDTDLHIRMRKKVSTRALNVSSDEGSGNPDKQVAKDVGARYRVAIDKMPIPRRFADMKVEGYEADTYSFLQRWKEVNCLDQIFLC